MSGPTKPTDQRPTVLLAEEDALIGLELSDALERAGYRVAGPLDTEASALARIERERPTLAVIDLRLKDGPSDALVRVLRDQGVPFLVHSEGHRDELPADGAQDAPWLAKPAWHRDVVDLLGELAQREFRSCCP